METLTIEQFVFVQKAFLPKHPFQIQVHNRSDEWYLWRFQVIRLDPYILSIYRLNTFEFQLVS